MSDTAENQPGAAPLPASAGDPAQADAGSEAQLRVETEAAAAGAAERQLQAGGGDTEFSAQGQARDAAAGVGVGLGPDPDPDSDSDSDSDSAASVKASADAREDLAADPGAEPRTVVEATPGEGIGGDLPAEAIAAVVVNTEPGDAVPPAGAALAAPADGQSTATAPADLSPAACAALLAQHFPALFGAPRALPIKLRIQADIQARAPGVFNRKSLSVFLHRYTTSTPYLKALATLPERFDLDGAPAGEVAAEHRDAAVAEVERRRAIVDARRQAERQAQWAAQKEAQRIARMSQSAASSHAPGGAPAHETALPAAGPVQAPDHAHAAMPFDVPFAALPGSAPEAPPRPPRPQFKPNDPRAKAARREARPPGPRPQARPGQAERPQQPTPDRPPAEGRAGGDRERHAPRGPWPEQGRPQRPQQRGEQPVGQPVGQHGPRHNRGPGQAHGQRPRQGHDALQDDAHRGPAHSDEPPPPPGLSPAELEARRERSQLLRAWESSTLTRANFCVLKRISTAELDAALAQAQHERGPRPAKAAR